MSRSPIDVSKLATRLSEMTIFELRKEWRRHHWMSPPMRLSRDILLRGILYQIQAKAYGGLSKGTLRRISQNEPSPSPRNELSDASAVKQHGPVTLRPGTRLVREWRGVTHVVLVHEDGFEWRGQRFKSLSTMAREITGAHWSGPRFFGMKQARSSRG